jgi:hypothetical protein
MKEGKKEIYRKKEPRKERKKQGKKERMKERNVCKNFIAPRLFLLNCFGRQQSVPNDIQFSWSDT